MLIMLLCKCHVTMIIISAALGGWEDKRPSERPRLSYFVALGYLRYVSDQCEGCYVSSPVGTTPGKLNYRFWPTVRHTHPSASRKLN